MMSNGARGRAQAAQAWRETLATHEQAAIRHMKAAQFHLREAHVVSERLEQLAPAQPRRGQ